MADFFVFATFDSVWSGYSANPTLYGGLRNATITDGDTTLTLNETTAFFYTGTSDDVGPYEMRSFSMGNGGTAIWMAGVGNSGGILVPTNQIAYDTLVAGDAFTITTNATLSSTTYAQFYVPPAPSNTAPTLSGAPSDLTVSEDVSSNLGLSGITVADADNDTLTMTLTASAGILTASSGGSVVVGGSGTGTMTLTGTAANINTFLDTASNVKYTGASNASGNNAATLQVKVNDTTIDSAISTINLDITAINDAPTGSGVPATITVSEDTASNFDLSAVTVADVDGDSLTVTIAASAGTFTATSGGSVVVGGSGTGTLTLAGTAANINAFLDTVSNIKYTGASNVNGTGAATFTINANDSFLNPLIGSGSINITAVNDAPTGTGAPGTMTVVEDTAGNFDLSGLSVADIDSDTLTVTVAASNGTFAATSGGSVTVGGSDTGVLTLTGTASDINTYLDTASNIQYTGPANISGMGAVIFRVTADDGFASTQVANGYINITPVNDAPTGSGTPATITALEDTASDFDLSGLQIIDYDGDTVTVTIAVSEGTFTATSGGSVTVGGSGTGTLTLTGWPGYINIFLDTATNIKYTGALNVNGTGAATFTINANDSTVNPQIGSGSIDITAVNDPITATGLPSTFTVTEDVAGNVDLSSLTLADVDGTSVILTLAVDAGTLAATSGGNVTVGSSGTATITLTGSIADVTTFLATASNVQYTGAENANGTDAATMSVSADDGEDVAPLGDVSIDITPVNDAPTIAGTSADIPFAEDTVGMLNLSAFTIADVDGDVITMTLTASSGRIFGGVVGSLIASNMNTSVVTFEGSISDINDQLSNSLYFMNYIGGTDVYGDNAATVTISIVDSHGASIAEDKVVYLDIAGVDDPATGAPEISGSAATGKILTASLGTVADVDGIDTDTFVWQWMRDGVDITNATGETYKLTSDDIGHKMSVDVTFTDLGSTVETLVSLETESVVRSGAVKSGGTGQDEILGTNGDDSISGKGGADVLRGLTGSDELRGGLGDDVIFGNLGNDVLHGGGGLDTLFGNLGDDTLFGGNGNDILYGGLGDDILTGGHGNDVFVFGKRTGNDTITDFQNGDHIQIRAGATNIRQLDFATSGSDVIISYAAVTITVENITISDLRDVDNFIFG